jgi:hypothetical protein
MADKDFEDLSRMFHELPRQLDIALGQAIRQSADEAASYARENHDYQDRTGALTNSIGADGPFGSFSGGDLRATVSAGAPYALYVEKGTRAHKIRPKYRGALRWPVEGGYAFAGEVNHPGTDPMPFIQTAVDATEKRMEAEILPDAIELAFVRAGFV